MKRLVRGTLLALLSLTIVSAGTANAQGSTDTATSSPDAGATQSVGTSTSSSDTVWDWAG